MASNQIDFSNICIYNSKLDGSEFVGLKYENDALKVYFPLGYHPAANIKEYRKDILNLISVLSEFSEQQESFFENEDLTKKQIVQFPIHAYLYLITDYLNHGYYTERDVIYRQMNKGKISWNKTVRQITPQIVDNNIVFFDFITRNVNHNENHLITLIHQYCVYESFEKIGFLFCDFMPQKPSVEFNAAMFVSVLQMKLAQTFNENQQRLFSNMLSIIRFLDNSNDIKSFYYGTENFAYVWESLVDRVYGISDKERFYPHCFWQIGKKKIGYSDASFMKYALRPDTIMITERGIQNRQKIFILDSKYYKYGESRSFGDLPTSGSIVKQLAYAQFIDRKEAEQAAGFKVKSEHIYNAFILPFDSNQSGRMKCVGYASSDYVDLFGTDAKEYYHIHGILLDVKSLMYEHNAHDDTSIAELSKMIENGGV